MSDMKPQPIPRRRMRLGRFLAVGLVAAVGAIGWLGNSRLRAMRLEKPLVAAVKAGNGAEVEAMLNQGADPNSRDRSEELKPSFWDALQTYIRGRRPTADESNPVLVIAASQGNVQVIKLLLDRGADVNASGEYGENSLFRAISTAPNETIRLLLDRGANPNALNVGNGTPLERAAERGKVETVQLLLAKGANLRPKPGIGGSMLELSLRNRAVTKLLLEHGADVNTKNSNNGNSLLAAAVTMIGLNTLGSRQETADDAAFVRYLIERGADVNAKDLNGRSVLQVATSLRLTQIADILKRAGAEE